MGTFGIGFVPSGAPLAGALLKQRTAVELRKRPSEVSGNERPLRVGSVRWRQAVFGKLDSTGRFPAMSWRAGLTQPDPEPPLELTRR